MKRTTQGLGILTFLTALSLLWAAGPAFCQQNLSGQVLQNSSGDDFAVSVLVDSTGKRFAQLYIANDHKMGWDSNGDIFYGAGFYKADPGNYYFVPTTGKSGHWPGGIGGFHVDKISWNDHGTTTAIVGLQPLFEGPTNISVTSNVQKPKLVGGWLYLKFNKFGGREYRFKIVFGKIVEIEPV